MRTIATLLLFAFIGGAAVFGQNPAQPGAFPPAEEVVPLFDNGFCEFCEVFATEPLPNEVGEGSSRAVQANARGRARPGCIERTLPSPGNLAERSISDPSRGAGGVLQVDTDAALKSFTTAEMPLPIQPPPIQPPPIQPLLGETDEKVVEQIRGALETGKPAAAPGILGDVLDVIRQRGSILDGSVLDPENADPLETNERTTQTHDADVDLQASNPPLASVTAANVTAAESLLRSARLLESIPGGDEDRRELVRKMRIQATRLLTQTYPL